MKQKNLFPARCYLDSLATPESPLPTDSSVELELEIWSEKRVLDVATAIEVLTNELNTTCFFEVDGHLCYVRNDYPGIVEGLHLISLASSIPVPDENQ